MSAILPSDVPTSLSEDEGKKLAELADGKVCLELGSWCGYSTICMAQTAELLFAVDHHIGDPHAGELWTLPSYIKNLNHYGALEHVVTIVGKFEWVCPFLAPMFDFVFIDGQHDEASVRRDAEFARNLLKNSEGVIAFHDYGNEGMRSNKGGGVFGVKNVVDELFSSGMDLVDTLAVISVGNKI